VEIRAPESLRDSTLINGSMIAGWTSPGLRSGKAADAGSSPPVLGTLITTTARHLFFNYQAVLLPLDVSTTGVAERTGMHSEIL